MAEARDMIFPGLSVTAIAVVAVVRMLRAP